MKRDQYNAKPELDGPYRDDRYEPYGANVELLLQEHQAMDNHTRRAREGLMAQMMIDALRRP